MIQNQSRRSRRTTKRDLLIIVVVCVAVFALSAHFDLFEEFSSWAAEHDEWQADEVATLLIVLAFGACIFAWRRWRELTNEASHRREVEKSLEKSQASFKQIVEQAGDLIYQNDEKGLFTFCNPTTSRVLKYSEAEMLGKHYLDVIAPACRLEVEEFYRQQLISGTHETYKELTVIAKDGEELFLGLKVQLLREAGRSVVFQTVARDITERRRTQEQLRQMQEYQNLFKLANDAILVLDAENGTVLDINDKACVTYGVAREDFIGRNLREFRSHPAEADQSPEDIRTGKLEPFETIHLRADGTPINFLVSPSVVEYRDQSHSQHQSRHHQTETVGGRTNQPAA